MKKVVDCLMADGQDREGKIGHHGLPACSQCEWIGRLHYGCHPSSRNAVEIEFDLNIRPASTTHVWIRNTEGVMVEVF